MEQLISVIVPVYNVEQYLEQCLDSVITQTYKKIEILLIDDGSTDRSGIICDEYALKDDRIRVFHVHNGGLSYARNIGLKNMKGQFVTFVDSDDFLNENYLSVLYQGIIENDSEISLIFPSRYVESDSTFRFYYLDSVEQKVFEPIEIVKLTNEYFINGGPIPDWVYYTAWGKLFRSQIFDTIRFPEGLLFEDSCVMHKTYLRATKILQIPESLYCYRQRENSITNHYDVLKLSEAVLYMCRERTCDLYRFGLNPKIDYPLQRDNLERARRMLESENKKNNQEYKEILSLLKRYN